ncbi:hypothetical protein PIB30_042010, partial [Stylosanthes scabra]|nr:hypothetical protein [Stylosanthes scabra]
SQILAEYQEHHALLFSSKSQALKQSSKPHCRGPPLTFVSHRHNSFPIVASSHVTVSTVTTRK